MEKSVTIVSALYYIGRDKWKHSAFPPGVDRYKSWVSNLLSLDTQLYFFVDDFYHDYIVEARKQYDPEFKKTIIKKIPITDLYFYKKYYVPEACLMFSPEFKSKVFFPGSADMNYPLYHIINFSKVDFVKKVAEENPYNSTHFFWCDAGGMRDNLSKYENVIWPKISDNCFNDKVIHFSHKEQYNIYPNKDEYFRSQDRNIQGTAWIVPKEKVEPFFNKIDNQVQTIIDEKIVGSDEKVYDFLHNEDKDFYQLKVCGWFEYFNVCNQLFQNVNQASLKNMKIKAVTVTWDYTESFDLQKTPLYKSFTKNNPGVELVHYHFNRSLYAVEELEFRTKFDIQSDYILYKVQLLKNKLEELDSDYVLFIDANDVVCLGAITPLVNAFDLENHVIVGHEKNQWPMSIRKAEWPNYVEYNEEHLTNKTFINSGVIFAKRTKYIEMLQSMIDNVFPTEIKTFGGDQGIFTYYYNANLQPSIQLDLQNTLTVNTYLRSVDEYKIEHGRLISNETGNQPCFVHDNGWNHGSPKYRDHFKLKNWYSDSYRHLKGLEGQKPMPPAHQEYLYRMRDEFGFTPKVIYDLGACVLHWTSIAKEVWPDAEYYLFDAMEESEEIFEETNHQYYIGVLSDTNNKEVTFYKNTIWPGGNSYYMENPQFSGMADHLFGHPENQFKRNTTTLDTVRAMKNFPYPNLLKIDVQGCEIDILKGCPEILTHVEHLIVELQNVEYNIGAELFETSIPFIESLGFELITPRFSMNGNVDGDYHFKRVR
jgi:FkbM family methyltransferase